MINQLSSPIDPQVYTWVILPILIFFARVSDVTLGTLRIIFISRGKRRVAPVLGFFEVLIWIVAIGQIVQNLQSVTSYLAYAAGFATGNFVGMFVEDKLAIGTLIVRAIVAHDAGVIAEQLKAAGYGVTTVDARGTTGQVALIFAVIKRKDYVEVMDIIHRIQPKAFVTVEELRSAQEGVFPAHTSRYPGALLRRKMK
jgi:uncharacterized protein YebE (UPF0316 family)